MYDIEGIINYCNVICEKEGLFGRVHEFKYEFHDAVRGYLKEFKKYKDLEEQESEKMKLSKCPFCGGEPKTVKIRNHIVIECSKCGITTPPLRENEVNGVWNVRVEEKGEE